MSEHARPHHRLASTIGALLLVAGLLPMAAPAAVLAAGSISLTAATYSENFDTLANTGTTNVA
ncbi:MAG TPA: hypothetical protein VFY18_03430, partial [Candidatus Limnocylindrales bacterium]|nr:hypothetical protein [Candidatus Limnocylindrales bacterium]